MKDFNIPASLVNTKPVVPLIGQTGDNLDIEVWFFFSSVLSVFISLPFCDSEETNTVFFNSPSLQDNREPPDCCLSESFTSPSCTLGVDLRRGRRRFSGNLQLPPLSWRQGERSRTPDNEVIARPTSLPFGAPPRIDITPVDPEW